MRTDGAEFLENIHSFLWIGFKQDVASRRRFVVTRPRKFISPYYLPLCDHTDVSNKSNTSV